MFTETNRRTFLAALAASGASIVGGARLFAQDATPDAHDDHDHDHEEEHEHDEHDHEEEEHDHEHEHATGSDVYLLVGDTVAETLAAYSTADGTLFGTLEGIVVNGHAGTINLPDGSALIVDDKAGRLLQVAVHEDHFEIVNETAVPGTVAHIAIESDHAHTCAVGTSGEDEFQLHLVDLEAWTVTSLKLEGAAEVGVIMTHDNLFHRNSGLNQLEAYDLHELQEGIVEPLSTLPIGTGGHGESVNAETSELFTATDDGIDVAYWEDGELVYGKTFAWPSSRGYFQRLINDGNHILTYTSDRSAPETEWSTWQNNVVIYDVATGDPIVTPLPDGYVFRYSLAEHVAVFSAIGGEGDALVTIDIDPESEHFGEVIATAPLAAMSTGAQIGDPFYEIGSYRATAILPDGSRAYVSQGGDGIVDIVDPIAGEVTTSVTHGSELVGGGTLAVFGPGVPLTDLIGR